MSLTSRKNTISHAFSDEWFHDDSRWYRTRVSLRRVLRSSCQLSIKKASGKTKSSTVSGINAKASGNLMKPDKSQSTHWIKHPSRSIANGRLSLGHPVYNQHQHHQNWKKPTHISAGSSNACAEIKTRMSETLSRSVATSCKERRLWQFHHQHCRDKRRDRKCPLSIYQNHTNNFGQEKSVKWGPQLQHRTLEAINFLHEWIYLASSKLAPTLLDQWKTLWSSTWKKP